MQAAGGASLTTPNENGTSESAAPILDGGRRRRLRLALVLVALSVYALDQISKLIALAELSDRPPVELAGGLLTLTLVFNSGAAFGLATGYTAVLTVLASGVVVVVLVLARKLASVAWTIAFALLLGGAVGNLTDRFFREPGPLRGHVVDFLQIPYWPVFNVADMAITGAAVMIVVATLTGRELDGNRRASESSPAEEQPQETGSEKPDGEKDVPDAERPSGERPADRPESPDTSTPEAVDER